MARRKISYQNWLVETGSDSRLSPASGAGAEGLETLERIFKSGFSPSLSKHPGHDPGEVDEVAVAVREALKMLREEEQEFVVRFYFMGESYGDISEKSGRAVHKLAALHTRAIKKLKQKLGPFVKRRYEIDSDRANDCPVCLSPHLDEINRVMRQRDTTQTWKPVMKTLKDIYGLEIKSPQILIGHDKYHRQ